MDGGNMTTAGFYNSEGTWGPNKVINAMFELTSDLKDTYTYPVYGWTWYNSVEEAQAAEGFGMEIVEEINLEVYGEPENG
jgi:hypothetical protein